MTPKRKKRMAFVLAVVVGVSVAVGLALYALSQNINLFYSPTQIVKGEAAVGQRIRAGGMVVDGSIIRDQKSLEVRFGLTDYEQTVTVAYNGILPDLFREGQGIIAHGRLDDRGRFVADEVLAKHDENYMPPEVAESLAKHAAAQEAALEAEADQQ